MTIGSFCAVEVCDRILTGRGEGHGMCTKHYQRLRKHGDPLWEPSGRSLCVIDGCESFVVGRGWCSKHYTRWERHGDPTTRVRGEVVDGKKVCAKCDEDLPVESFSRINDPCRTCHAAAAAARRKVSPSYTPVSRVPKTCDACGTTFPSDARRSRYCTTQCAEAYKHKANWKHVVSRRARLRDAFVETFDRLDIFKRDGWLCQLCGGPTDPEAAWPSSDMPSVDHVVPVSRGGLHSRSNAQTSHLGCNIRKSNRLEVV